MASALEQQSGIIQRLSELATQSANGVLSDTQRRSLNSEYQQLLLESGRIAEGASFNDTLLLQAGRSNGINNLSIQVGTSGGSDSSLSINTTNTLRFSGNLNIAGDIGAQGGIPGSDGSIDNNDQIIYLDYIFDDALTEEELVRLGSAATVSVVGSDGITRDFAVVIHAISSTTNGRVDVFAKNADGTYDYRSGADVDFDPLTGQLVGASTKSINLFGTSGTAVLDFSGLRAFAAQSVNGKPSVTSAPNSAIDFTAVGTSARALEALEFLSNRRLELGQHVGRIGAMQSRFESALSLARTLSENTLAAASRIMDSDIAAESARLIRNQILQQTATSVLANAGQQPQLALILLQ